jgi:hypothetical protein
MSTIQQLASDALSYLVRRHRTDVYPQSYILLHQEAPEWMRDLVYSVHDGMLPDDWRFAFIQEALDDIANGGDDAIECASKNESVYTSDHISWLGSHISRWAIVDEATAEYDLPANAPLSHRVNVGMHAERIEVYNLVLEALRTLADDDCKKSCGFLTH